MVVALVLGGCHFLDSANETLHRPNIVLILVDTLRTSYLDLYGYPADTTPFLSELAESSAVFDRAFSTSSWTAPSTASVFTGQYPWTHGIKIGFYLHINRTTAAERRGEPTIPLNTFGPERRTLPMRLQELGYDTVGMASNVNIGDAIGFSRGFDRFDYDHRADVRTFLRRLEKWKSERTSDAPHFVYLHLNDCHQPYEKHDRFFDEEEARVQEDRARYLSEVRYADAQLRALYELLADDDTIFVVLSDHGEEFQDHGGRGHTAKLYDELNRVLMLIHGASSGVRAGRFDGVNVSLIDVLPTLLELAGVDTPQTVEGVSLAPLVRRDEDESTIRARLRERVLFAHRRGVMNQDLWAAIEGYWKLILLPDGSSELFDHRDDPEETSNLRDEHQDIDSRLRTLLEPVQARTLQPSSERKEIAVDEELERTLRSLGYVR